MSELLLGRGPLILTILALVTIGVGATVGAIAFNTSSWLRNWFNEAGNPVRLFTWILCVVAVIITVAIPWHPLLDELRPEAISTAFAVIVLSELAAYQFGAQERKRIIQQMRSQVNDAALEAIRIARDRGWLTNGKLRGVDLNRANLVRALLEGANLRDTRLYEADLSDAKMRNANLERATLDAVNLRGADLSNANMRQASLRNADLSGANLYKANLLGTNMTGAILRDSSLKEAVFNDSTIWPAGFDAMSADAWYAGWDKTPSA